MKLIFLYIVLILMLVFDSIPYDGTPRDLFLFYDQPIVIKTWVYFLFEHIAVIALSFVIWKESIKYRTACKIFFILQIGDLIDYLLTYNTEWYLFLSYNVIASIIFTFVIVYEYVGGVD